MSGISHHIKFVIEPYLIEHRNNNALDTWQWYESQLDEIDDFGKLDIFKQVILPTFK